MKIKKLLLVMSFLFIITGMGGCDDEEKEYSDYVEGYIVGSFICNKTNKKTGSAIDKTKRGYCILLNGSKNTAAHWPMDFYTFEFPDGEFSFPNEFLSPDIDGNNCGPVFFPEESKHVYKIKFSYKILNELEQIQFVCGSCVAMDQSFPWSDYKEISLKNITKLQ
ncbi:hypothetical protein [Limibacterium fermenti]|uniref:hypothetical protein n=1 Tax=Limibacterium fermenti TaxID=3229863 RepID=UPI003A6273C2